MKQNYECLYIISSDVNEEKRNKLIEKFQTMAGTDVTVEKWGMRKFVTPINYRPEGFYVLMNFSSTAEVPSKITALMNITEGIVRHMFVAKEEKVLKVKKAKAKKKPAAEQPVK
jgi:small subunit ribosomal protein S6